MLMKIEDERKKEDPDGLTTEEEIVKGCERPCRSEGER